jgi:molybdate transport system substrate-binding protein
MKRLALLLAIVLAGCGGDGDSGRLTVSAASSLKTALPRYEPNADYSFAGSDILAAQIEAGARPDVFVAANTVLPAVLFAKRLVEKPVVFAGNRLVIAVPVGAPGEIKSIADLAKPGVTIAAGSPSVPVGSYTRTVLRRLPPAEAERIVANIRSNEPDVTGVVGKLTQGAVDAGFVYATDVQATGGKLTAIQIPARLEPRVAYEAAVVRDADHHDEAAKFVKGLLSGKGAAALMEAGFDPPPTSGP